MWLGPHPPPLAQWPQPLTPPRAAAAAAAAAGGACREGHPAAAAPGQAALRAHSRARDDQRRDHRQPARGQALLHGEVHGGRRAWRRSWVFAMGGGGGGGGKGAACSSARLPLPRLPPSLAPCLPFPHPAAPATCQAQCRLALRVPTHPVLPPFGQVAKDRFKSLQKRGLIEPRRPAHHRKGRRVQYVGGERTEKALEGQVRALKGAEGGGAGRGGGGQIIACMLPGHCLALSAGAADASGSPVLS